MTVPMISTSRLLSTPVSPTSNAELRTKAKNTHEIITDHTIEASTGANLKEEQLPSNETNKVKRKKRISAPLKTDSRFLFSLKLNVT